MLRRVLVVGIALLLALGCEGGQRGARVDHAGDPLPIAANNRRIVSLSPSLTELLFAIGVGDRVVGRTRWCTYPAAVRSIPSVGDGLDPNLELILARAPDVVVFYHTPANAAVIERLRQVGVSTISVRMDRLGDVPVAARLLGRVLGEPRRADSVAAAFDTELQRRRAVPTDSGPGVLVLTWDAPPIVIGAGSFLTELLTLAGAHNVFGDLPHPSAAVSIEAIAARDPDVLLLTGAAAPTFVERSEWQVVRAVREQRIARVDGSAYSWPSPRSLAAIDSLAFAMRAVGR